MVRGASLAVGRGEMVGLVGESGSGKTLTALAVLGLVPPPRPGDAASIRLDGPRRRTDLLTLGAARAAAGARRPGRPWSSRSRRRRSTRSIRSASRSPRRCAPTGALSRREAADEAARLLDRVALPEPRRRLDDYPHQLSGGQRQRVMIAMALAGRPDLLLADEPTTALDVTLQAQILELLAELRRDLGLAVLLITHDLGVVAETCDRVVVMHAGRVVEEAAVAELFRAPAHPYTRELLAALPRLGAGERRGERPAQVEGLPRSTRCGAACCGAGAAPCTRSAGVDLRVTARRMPGAGGGVGERQDDARPLRPPPARADRRPRRASTARTCSRSRRRSALRARRRRFQMVFQDPYGLARPARSGSARSSPSRSPSTPRLDRAGAGAGGRRSC